MRVANAGVSRAVPTHSESWFSIPPDECNGIPTFTSVQDNAHHDEMAFGRLYVFRVHDEHRIRQELMVVKRHYVVVSVPATGRLALKFSAVTCIKFPALLNPTLLALGISNLQTLKDLGHAPSLFSWLSHGPLAHGHSLGSFRNFSTPVFGELNAESVITARIDPTGPRRASAHLCDREYKAKPAVEGSHSA